MGPEENLDWQCEVAPRLGWRTGWWRRLETALEQIIGVQFSLESRWRRIACIGGLLLNMEGWVNWGCRERFTNLSLWEADLLWLLQCLPLTHKCFHSTFPVLHFLTKLTFIPSPQGNKSLLICLQNITYSHEPGRTWEQTCQTGEGNLWLSDFDFNWVVLIIQHKQWEAWLSDFSSLTSLKSWICNLQFCHPSYLWVTMVIKHMLKWHLTLTFLF